MQLAIIDEGTPGHRTQSEGIAALLERAGVEVNVSRISVENHLPGFLRSPMRALMSLPSPWLCRMLLPFCSRVELARERPDVLICSGGKSAFAARALSLYWRVPVIFVGVPEPFPDHWFSLIISPVERTFAVPSLVSGIIPTPVTPEKTAAAAKNLFPVGVSASGVSAGECWAVLIGGNSKSHHYSEADWRAMVAGINTLGHQLGIRWLITTSRRTPSDIEGLLEDELDEALVEKLVLFRQQPEKVVMGYLGQASRVLVTQDSLTMASEALASGKPVTLLQPEKLVVQPGSFFADMIERFPQLDGVEAVGMQQLGEYRPAVSEHQPLSLAGLEQPLLAFCKEQQLL
ncbi:ELM1/GtrOC1 family putative glycosyltransferase [Pokkaliibacter sp. CJK22405]|uniref:ELM1/GtrOC1 family putative glycosyltransferase n=1 Tax=Pokkaliibacter sp. CJK22405 TaxID=3384615 RepID=UPI00398529B8